MIEVTQAVKARFKAILDEHLPGDQYAEIREIFMKNQALRKYSQYKIVSKKDTQVNLRIKIGDESELGKN